jgi:glycosyltransferase involved in cell wall biosynthesis
MLLAKLAARPYVVEHHGYQAICPNGVLIYQPDRAICPGHFQAGRYAACIRCQQQEMSLPKACSKLFLMFPRYWLSRKADLNIAITHHSLKRHRLPRAQTIYYGIETAPHNEIEETSRTLEARDTETNSPCFAYVGRLVPEKGLDVLLRAASLLQNDGSRFQVLLIGDGPERANLEALISANNLQSVVRITGFLRGSALTAQMDRVDAVVMPSTWEETAGLSAIEQMMRGRLVIASDIGGLGEIVGDAGLKFPAGDAASLAAQMKKVIQHSAEISRLEETAEDRAHSMFLADRMAAEHVSTYQKLD